MNPINGHYLYPPFFPNTKAKEEKSPFIWGSWVNPPPVFCKQSKYLITKVQTFCESSIETDPLSTCSISLSYRKKNKKGNPGEKMIIIVYDDYVPYVEMYTFLLKKSIFNKLVTVGLYILSTHPWTVQLWNILHLDIIPRLTAINYR